jgi:urease gamma subunit
MIELVRQNVTLKDRIDSTVAIQNDIKERLRDGLKELGEVDDRGHLVVEVNDELTGIKKVVNQRKVSKSLDMSVAEEVLKEKGLHDRCVMMVPVLDEEAIMAAYYEGLVTEEDIDKMFPAKVSWALVMSKS